MPSPCHAPAAEPPPRQSGWFGCRLVPTKSGVPMTSPTPQQLAQSGSLEELYAQLTPIKVVPGWAKTAPSLWPEPKKSFQALLLELRPGQGRARRRRPADQHRAGRAPQPDHAEPGDRLRHLAHHRRGLSDDHAGGEGALAPPHPERAAARDRRRARRLHRRQRRAARHDAGRRGADAELVLARPRQRRPRLRLLARRARRAAGAAVGSDVLRSASGRVRDRGHGAEFVADAFLLGRHAAPAQGGGSGWRTARAMSRSRWAIPRSTPWRCR